MGGRLIVQAISHILAIVGQWIFIVNGMGFVYELIIPLLLHVIIFLMARNLITKDYANSLNKLINKYTSDKRRKTQ